MKAQVSSPSRSLGVRLRGFSDRGIRFSSTSSTSSTVASLMPTPSTVPPSTAPGYRLFLDTRWPVRRWSQGTGQPITAAASWGHGRKPTAIAACLVLAPAASFTPRWAIRTSLVVPPGGTCSRRARSSLEWPGRCPSSRASGLRPSLPGVHLRVSRTAVPARTAASVVPALATRAHAGPAAGSSLSAILSEGARRAVRGSAVSKGSTLPSASASRKAPTGSLRVGALNRDEGQNLRSGETFTTVDVPRAGTQP